MTPQTSDFYEDDEPVEKIMAAWHAGKKGLTAKPRTSLLRAARRAFHATLGEWHARAMNWHLDRVIRRD